MEVADDGTKKLVPAISLRLVIGKDQPTQTAQTAFPTDYLKDPEIIRTGLRL